MAVWADMVEVLSVAKSSKVDRSAAYAARWAAKHVVAAGLATKFEIQLAYVIGVAEPVSLMVDSFGTGVLSDEVLAEKQRLISELLLLDGFVRPIYKETSVDTLEGLQQMRVISLGNASIQAA